MGGRWASRWRRAANKIGLPCVSFSSTNHAPHLQQQHKTISSSVVSKDAETSGLSANKNLCAICLEPLRGGGDGDDSGGGGGGESGAAVFTAHCWHSFHFTCIASNVRHGNMTCPICRAHWPNLPRALAPPCHWNDPILRILDDSIATSRVNRRTSLRSTRYNDDDPVEPDISPPGPHLDFALIPCPLSLNTSPNCLKQKRFYLSVKLAHQQAMDIVLVASPNGPHLRLLKQAMALVIFSLRSVDRLAIVTYSSSASRAFALRRMTAHGKRTALQAIDRLFYMGEADPVEGLSKGVKILEDRSHQNPLACILHLSDSPTRAYANDELMVHFPVHRFHIGFGYGLSNGFVMHEFEEFLAKLLGGVVKEVQLMIGDNAGWVRLGELRGGEERRIPVDVVNNDCMFVCVGYSFIEGGGDEERMRAGEVVVEVGEKSERGCRVCGVRDRELIDEVSAQGRLSNVHRRDYLDPFMARRWAKHLHGYRA
ncbi:putative chromatin regulator PHD family [Dioscorea sansibarensis]